MGKHSKPEFKMTVVGGGSDGVGSSGGYVYREFQPQEVGFAAPSQVRDVIAWLTPDRRKKLYLILTTLAPILVVYGIVEQETVTLWLSLAATILIGGTAALHTPKTS